MEPFVYRGYAITVERTPDGSYLLLTKALSMSVEHTDPVAAKCRVEALIDEYLARPLYDWDCVANAVAEYALDEAGISVYPQRLADIIKRAVRSNPGLLQE